MGRYRSIGSGGSGIYVKSGKPTLLGEHFCIPYGYALLTQEISHEGRLYPGQHPRTEYHPAGGADAGA